MTGPLVFEFTGPLALKTDSSLFFGPVILALILSQNRST